MHPTNKISTTINFNQKKKKVDKKLFLIKTIILICEEIDISKKKIKFKLKSNTIKIKLLTLITNFYFLLYHKNHVVN